MLPYVKGGKEKCLSIEPYDHIKLLFPGRHQNDTVPVGGDFVVCVTDNIFKNKDHQFTHNSLFKAVEAKRQVQQNPAQALMEDYLNVVTGSEIPSPSTLNMTIKVDWLSTMDDFTFLKAVQCLAVAEHRRYAKHEARFGGRFLPARFTFGIAEGLWTAADAAGKQRMGRPGVEWLEKEFGIPILTKELMG